jgi:predicted RNase H-like nuclease
VDESAKRVRRNGRSKPNSPARAREQTLADAGGVRRFLGLDLAWSARNRSGVAALDERGAVIDARADLGDDAAIVAWVRSHLAPTAVLGIDMPTIVPNETGIRPCERALARDFRAFHAAPHPANRGRFPDGGRARAILDALAADGVGERLDVPPRSAGRYAFEVFPHPAHVRLFALPAIFRYKKKSRPWPLVLAEWSRYRAALETLAAADPPLALGDAVPLVALERGYKRFDDLLDAVTCAYVASFLWRWGTAAPHARIYGDLATGYIAIPDRPATIVKAPNGEGPAYE